jgi:hypothetical protein
MSYMHLLQKDFTIFRHFLGESFLVQLVHLDHFNFIRIRQRRINSFARDKLADPGHQPQSLFAEKKIDKGFTGIGVRGLGTERDRLTISHELAESNVIQRDSLFTVKDHVL